MFLSSNRFSILSMTELRAALLNNRRKFHNITPFDFKKDKFLILDFSIKNEELKSLDLNDENAFNGYVFDNIHNADAKFGIGGYGEDRIIYKRSEVFSGEESRSLHLGIDVWAAAGTPVNAPMDSTVHSFKNNNQHGDYGPTIILQHELDGITFYTLYGHLNTESIQNLRVGDKISAGQEFTKYGTYAENVHWPPHLHFQIISEIGDYYGDYPGVCAPSQKDKWLKLCPDPNLIINLEALNQ